MSDTNASAPGTPGVLAKAGEPEAGNFIMPGQQQAAASTDNNSGADENGNAGGQAAAPNTDDQLAAMLKERGIELDDKGIDGLKEKLNGAIVAPPPPEPVVETPEQIAEKEKAFEKRMLDHFLEEGGSIEQFMSLKEIANADLRALSEQQLRMELKDANFSEEEIAVVLKERYYQINPEELVQGEDETEEDFEKRKALVEKKIAFGSKKLENKGSYTKKQAGDALDQLRQAIATKDMLVKKEAELSSKVDEIATSLPSKITFQLGKVNDKEEPPIEYNVSPEHIAEVTAIMKNPAERNKILFNEDNSFNLAGIMELMVKNKALESSVKAGFIEGGNRRVAEFEAIFPGRTASAVGVGGNQASNTGRKGVFTRAGEPEAASRNK